MLEAVRRIETYTAGMDRAAFLADTRTQDAVIRNLEIVGEAARNVQRHDPAFVAAHPEVPWAIAYRMRNVLSHGYADVDLDVVWSTITTALPDLREADHDAAVHAALRGGGPIGRSPGAIAGRCSGPKPADSSTRTSRAHARCCSPAGTATAGCPATRPTRSIC
ncbi:MAG: DUF86 domain-containing protein [Acetobacteraceae bacterium]|nr:DUF86 domain-containing protein [Acetobacteraceae bacterium]